MIGKSLGRTWVVHGLLLVCLASSGLSGCSTAEEPSKVQVIILEGTPYERGFQHGQQLSAHIKSLYTRLLASSILPFLNREQLNIAPVLPVYSQPEYLGGKFSFLMLLESGQYLYDHHMPEAYQQELHGIADGAEMEFEEVLVLNTFFDTMLGFRAIVMFILGIQEPYIESFTVLSDLTTDGFDNDGDGDVDEAEEGLIDPYSPNPRATLVEVPTDASLRLVLQDPNLPGLACIDPRNVQPLADLMIDRECVIDDCLLRECRNDDQVGRDCIVDEEHPCIEPRISGQCVVEGCAESTDPACVNPDSVRLTLNGQTFLSDDAALEIILLPLQGDPPPDAGECAGPLQVTFSPPGGMEPASEYVLSIQAGDLSPIYSPAPYHNRNIRGERITFTTAGYAQANGRGNTPLELPNRGISDPGSRPPSLGFAVRGTATPQGNPLLAHHYALLDSDMVHEHSVLFVQIPDEGQAHGYLGWAGLIWGFSGMNEDGLTYALNNSDTLDNPLVGGILETMFLPENMAILLLKPDLEGLAEVLADAHLYANGIPVGLSGREMLTNSQTVTEARDYLYANGRTYGWNYLLADASGDLLTIESDAASQYPESGTSPTTVDEDGFRFFDPDPLDPGNLDPQGQPWGSVGPDDLRMTSHFVKNAQDMVELPLLGLFAPRIQSYWSIYYYRSLRASSVLAEEIAARYGQIDLAKAIEILRVPDLVDSRDSMNACVYEPARQVLHWAMGGVPATDQPFVEFDLGAYLDERGGS